MQGYVQTETTYDKVVGKRFIKKVMADPGQMRQVLLLADAMVPARELPLEQVRAPTLIVGSRYDGDIGYENSVNSNVRISGSTLITVEQFGHFIWWGDPDVTRDFERQIEDFLARHVRLAGT
jgi:pimeloyl-ACP methyl ester carboxylesterase